MWSAKYNSKLSDLQRRDAEEVIESILKDEVGPTDIIVDIGCGSGKVTELVAEHIPHKMVYGFDLCPDMVSYANESFQHSKATGESNNNSNIAYFVDNISLPWDELSDELHQLEGKVSLVICNFVLHWIPKKDRPIAINNMTRLLHPGGKCYLNIIIFRDIDQCESVNMQMSSWDSCFGSSGLSKVKNNWIGARWEFDNNAEWYEMLRLAQRGRLFGSNCQLTMEQKEEVLKKWEDTFARTWCVTYGENPAEKVPDNLTTWFYERIFVVGTK